ncbi:MAG: L,D-transpeptidase family protein, partial [bacterium]
MRPHKFKTTFLLCTIFIFMCMPRLSAVAQSGTDGGSNSPQSNPDIVTVEIPPDVSAVPEAPIDEPVIVRRVLISLADQKMWIFEGESIIKRFKVSTGVPGHRTPPGEYRVRNKAPKAYSKRYEA